MVGKLCLDHLLHHTGAWHMTAPKFVPHEYVTGVLYMLRDKFTVFGNTTQIDEFNAGEVFLYNGKNFYSTEDGALIAPGIIKKKK